MLIIRSSNCINTASGISGGVQVEKELLNLHTRRSLIPDAVLTQFDLLMMSTDLLEHVKVKQFRYRPGVAQRVPGS